MGTPILPDDERFMAKISGCIMAETAEYSPVAVWEKVERITKKDRRQLVQDGWAVVRVRIEEVA